MPSSRRRRLSPATGLWAAFAVWEWISLAREENIWVELFGIYLVLLIGMVWALVDELRPHNST